MGGKRGRERRRQLSVRAIYLPRRLHPFLPGVELGLPPSGPCYLGVVRVFIESRVLTIAWHRDPHPEPAPPSLPGPTTGPPSLTFLPHLPWLAEILDFLFDLWPHCWPKGTSPGTWTLPPKTCLQSPKEGVALGRRQQWRTTNLWTQGYKWPHPRFRFWIVLEVPLVLGW